MLWRCILSLPGEPEQSDFNQYYAFRQTLKLLKFAPRRNFTRYAFEECVMNVTATARTPLNRIRAAVLSAVMFALLLSGCGARVADNETPIPDSERINIVYAADFEFAPFRVSTDQGYFGYEIDVNTAIFTDTKYKLEYVFRDLAIDNLEELAKSDEIDIFGWRVITPLTKQYMLLSDPVYEFNWGAVTLPDIGELTESDLFNYKIGIVHKKYPYNYLVSNLGIGNYVIFDSYIEAAESLIDGDIDIWFEEREISNYYLIRTSHYATTVFHEETNIPVPVGLLIRPDHTELHAEINRQIAKMKEINQLESFYYRHFQKHSREYFKEQERNTRNIILICVASVIVLIAITLYIYYINRKYRRTAKALSVVNISLEEAKEQFSAAVDGANDGILYYSERTGRLILSERFCEILGTGHKKRFELGELFEILFSVLQPRHHERVREFASYFSEKREGFFFEEFSTADAAQPARWVSVRIKLERRHGNWTAGGTLSDITERKEAEAKALYYAQHDYLTGIYNRLYLMRLANERISAARERREAFFVMYIDLDNFKKINDTYGHDHGDDALRAVVGVVRDILPEDAVFARVGGDEFVVLLPAKYQADSICGEMTRKISALSVRDVRIGASIGISCYPEDYETIEELIVSADTASRFSKDNGKNRWSYYGGI